MSALKVSVIIPVFNNELYIKQAVDSILGQTFTDFELICIDDFSSDASLETLQTYNDPRIILIANNQNQGVAKSRNTAILKAQGEYIAFLDSDDIALPERLEKQVRYLDEHPEADVVFGRVMLTNVYGTPDGRWEEDERFIEPEEIKNRIPISNCVANPAAMLRKSSLPDIPFHDAYQDSEDWGLWLEMICNGKSLHKIDEVLCQYRIRPKSKTQKSNANPLQKIIRFRKTFLGLNEKNEGNNKIHSIIRKQLRKEKIQLITEKIFRKPVKIIFKIIRANPLKLIVQLIRLKRILSMNKRQRIFFFFPFVHVGGAEKVHYSITRLVKEENPIIFITKKSENTGYLNHFTHNGQVIDIWRLAWYPVFKKILAKMLARHINSSKKPVVISSNSILFYEMLPYLNNQVYCIDLIHAFVHPEENGPEKWSVPVVEKLNKRVFIGQKAMDEMKALYASRGIQMTLTERFELIRNFVDLPEFFNQREIEDYAKLIYIGRDTPEKRVNLAIQIAAAYSKIKGKKTITMIGPFDKDIISEHSEHCIFSGRLDMQEEVYKHLRESDILLLTSSREGFPMAIAEAMACGVIPVCTAVGDIPNIIRNGKNGFLLPPDDHAKIISTALQIIDNLEHDKELVSRMRYQTRKDAEHLFGRKVFEQRWRNLILQA